MNPRARKPNFFLWLTANGAELRVPCRNEVARFLACDTLCIVYVVNRKGRQAFVPDLARTAWDAWQARQKLDLSNTLPGVEVPVEDWHFTGIALCAVATRAKAGERLNVDAEAAALSIAPARLLRSMRAFGANSEGGPP